MQQIAYIVASEKYSYNVIFNLRDRRKQTEEVRPGKRIDLKENAYI